MSQIALRHFGRRAIRRLAARGIEVFGPYGDFGYRINNNGCGMIWTHAQIVGAAQ